MSNRLSSITAAAEANAECVDIFRLSPQYSISNELYALLLGAGIPAVFGMLSLALAFAIRKDPSWTMTWAFATFGVYLFARCWQLRLAPFLRRRACLGPRELQIGSLLVKLTVPYDEIEEIWTPPNSAIHDPRLYPYPIGLAVRIRTNLRLIAIALRYEEADRFAVMLWLKSKRASYWDMHGQLNPPHSANLNQPTLHGFDAWIRWINIHTITVAILILLALLSVFAKFTPRLGAVPVEPGLRVWMVIITGFLCVLPAWSAVTAIRVPPVELPPPYLPK